MVAQFYPQFSNRTVVISALVLIVLLYVLYTFNACLLSSVHRTFSVRREKGVVSWAKVIRVGFPSSSTESTEADG